MPSVTFEGGHGAFLIEDCFCYPGKWRRIVRRESDGKETYGFVLNADHLWSRVPGRKVESMPLPPPNARMPAELAALEQLTQLRDSKSSAVVGPAEESAGRTLVPLTLLSGGRPQSTTYFDDSTNLIVKVKKLLLDVSGSPQSLRTPKTTTTETTYADYKNFEGVVVPTHMVMSQAGKKILNASILKVEFPSKFDAKTFEKPQDE